MSISSLWSGMSLRPSKTKRKRNVTVNHVTSFYRDPHTTEPLRINRRIKESDPTVDRSPFDVTDVGQFFSWSTQELWTRKTRYVPF